jgi:uncharacterized protein (DUF2384 family)
MMMTKKVEKKIEVEEPTAIYATNLSHNNTMTGAIINYKGYKKVNPVSKVKKTIDLPEIGDLNNIFFYLNNHEIDSNYLSYFNTLTDIKDEIKSNWLNMNLRTLRNYIDKESILKENTKELIVMLISLFKHGVEVFGSKASFDKWVISNNLFLDNKPPMDFLDTVSGIKFINDRLSAIEYGDNI